MSKINTLIYNIFTEAKKYDGKDLQWITHKPKDKDDLARMWKNRFLTVKKSKF